MTQENFKETKNGFTAKKGVITIALVLAEDEWHISVTAFGIFNIMISIQDILNLLKKKNV